MWGVPWRVVSARIPECACQFQRKKRCGDFLAAACVLPGPARPGIGRMP